MRLKLLNIGLTAALASDVFAQSTSLNNVAKLREITVITDPAFLGGAKCDGTTDDTAAIQAAVNSGAKEVHAPGGTCFTGTITVPSNIVIVGTGPNSTVFKLKKSTNGDLFSVTAKSFVTFKDFRIEGNSANQNQGAGI